MKWNGESSRESCLRRGALALVMLACYFQTVFCPQQLLKTAARHWQKLLERAGELVNPLSSPPLLASNQRKWQTASVMQG